MNNYKTVYIGFTCDEWKSRDSMRLEIATTSKRRFIAWVKGLIKAGDAEVGDDNILHYLFTGKLPDVLFCNELDSILGYVHVEARNE